MDFYTGIKVLSAGRLLHLPMCHRSRDGGGHQRKDGMYGLARTQIPLEPPAARGGDWGVGGGVGGGGGVDTLQQKQKPDERECWSSCVDCLLQLRVLACSSNKTPV